MEEKKEIKTKKKKRKVRFKGIIILLLAGYLLLSFGMYIYKKPITNITIEGNSLLKDNYLISYLDLKDESVFKVSKRSIKNKLLELDLISDVKVSKNYLGSLKITIKEENVLFYQKNSQELVLTNGKKIPYNDSYLGIPVLINTVPDKIYQELINKLKIINLDVLKLVSEIEYSPNKVDDKVVDDKRFLLKMNDGNKVYVNTVNIEKFNDYLDIYESIVNNKGNVKGCLYLDSKSENNSFNNCESIKEEVVDDDNEREN